MTRIMEALAARMDRVRKGDKGFTLIELLVVVIIIGILAAIAIPVYIGVQNNAKDSAVKSDLTNAKTAVVAYYTQNPDAAVADVTAANIAEFGYKQSTNVSAITLDVTSSTNFCIQANRTDDPAAIFSVTADGSVVTGACA